MALRQKSVSNAAGLALGVLLLIVIFNFTDQSLLSPSLNPLLLDFFGRTSNVVPLGWVTFALTLCSAVSMVAAGIFSDRTSRLRICLAGCLTYGAFSALTVLAPHGRAGYVFFFITRALNGIGIGVVIPAVFSLVSDMVSPERRSTAFGFMSMSMLVGRLSGFLIAGTLAAGWRASYFAVGAVNLLLAAALFLVREPKRGGREPELRDVILAGAEYRFRISFKDIGMIRAAKSNVWLILNFIDVFPGSIILFLIFKYMKDVHNMDARIVNAAILAVFAAGAAGALIFGRLGDWGFRKDNRARALVALVCNGLPIVFMFVFVRSAVWIPAGANLSRALAVPGMWGLVLAVAAAMFVNQGVNPNWYSSLADINLPEHRATMVSLASVADMIGNALGPLLASYVATVWGLKAAMSSVLIFWVLNVFFWVPVLIHIRRDLDHVHRILAERAREIERSRTPHGL